VAFQPQPRYAAAPPEHVTIGSHNLPALLVRPDAPGPHPAAVIQHGYGASKEDLVPLAVYLAAFGFISLLPDAWEHGERLPSSGRTWMNERSSDYFFEVTRHTTGEMKDALSELAQRPDVRADALLVGGFSMGAMAALVVGTEDTRVAGVVSIAGAPLPDLVAVSLFDLRPLSESTSAWAREHDVTQHIGRLAPKPLLISHGRADDMVPVAGALRLYEAARPHYASHPERLALMLYDHTHTVTPEQLAAMVGWVAPFFLDDGKANILEPADGPDELDEERAG
jgi:predicted esterase